MIMRSNRDSLIETIGVRNIGKWISPDVMIALNVIDVVRGILVSV